MHEASHLQTAFALISTCVGATLCSKPNSRHTIGCVVWMPRHYRSRIAGHPLLFVDIDRILICQGSVTSKECQAIRSLVGGNSDLKEGDGLHAIYRICQDMGRA